MDSIWQRFKAVFSNIPGAKEALNSAARSEDIKNFEKNLGLTLPVDYKNSILIHDGQSGELFLFGWRLWSLDEVVQNSIENKKIKDECFDNSGQIKNCIANCNWIYIADNGGSGHLSLDLDPGLKGTVGQVIAIYEDGQELIADSFRSYMEMTVSDIESGKLVWDEGGCFVDALEIEDDDETSFSHAEFLKLREQSPSYSKVKKLKNNESITLVGAIKVNNKSGKHTFSSLGYSLELSGEIPSSSSKPKMVSITIKAGGNPLFGFGKRTYEIISHHFLE